MLGERGKGSSWLSSRQTQIKDFSFENGSMLLEKMLSFCDGKCTPIRSFSTEEIIKATNSFDPCLVLADNLYFKLYKGYLGSHLVSVKQYIWGSSWSLEIVKSCAIRDIVINSQMNKHKNVLKLLGCCLESELPVVVYEYAESVVPLSKFLKSREVVDHDFKPILSWKNRLSIANQIANAVVYLHTALPSVVVHRNLKPLGILTDQLGAAKLSDFSVSISIPSGETKVADLVTGTYGFIDPEYFSSNFVTCKSDVYSFGVVLMILLTGHNAVDMDRGEDEAHIVEYVKKRVGEDCFREIVDPRILGEGAGTEKEQQWKEVLALSMRCIQERQEMRPDMIDVAKELRRIERSVHVG